MANRLKLDYYYGIESEQFAFYRVPRLLIKDDRFKGLSSDAKLLYGLMLDRMSLSMKNGWLDDENRAYIIYTIDNIVDDLGCGRDKAMKVLAELDSAKGIGLVEKVRRGLGKPDIIYVKNFATITDDFDQKEAPNPCKFTEVGKVDFKKSEKPTSRSRENRLQEVEKTDFKKSEKPTSASRKNRPQEVGKTDSNYINNNYNNNSNTDMNYNNHINQSETENRLIDEMDDVNDYVKLIKSNIAYDERMGYYARDQAEIYDELFQVICEVVCVKRPTVTVGGEPYPYELVKSRFLKLDNTHLEYVMECMKNTNRKISNIKSYMITALYNAPATISHYYQQEVQHDMYGYKKGETYVSNL